MKQPAITPLPLPAAKTLTEQKSDFTAEGAPPPGKAPVPVPLSVPPAKPAAPPLKPVS
jgi:hypothetical protein